MISIKYKSGWLRFRTIEELSELTGWSFDKITYALKTKTSIRGIELAFGQIQNKTQKLPVKKIEEKRPSYQELKNDLRMVRKRKSRAERVIKRYEESWFPGRIETNEIKHARNEAARLRLEVDRLKRAIEHYKRYEQGRKITDSVI